MCMCTCFTDRNIFEPKRRNVIVFISLRGALYGSDTRLKKAVDQMCYTRGADLPSSCLLINRARRCLATGDLSFFYLPSVSSRLICIIGEHELQLNPFKTILVVEFLKTKIKNHNKIKYENVLNHYTFSRVAILCCS